MLNGYIKIAFRSLLHNKTFSFLNIFGLALSMGVCLFVILLTKDAHSYDLFHPDGERVYRILTDATRKEGRDESYASSPFPVGKALTEDFPQVELWTPLVRTFGGDLVSDGKTLQFEGIYTNSSFFEMFGFELAEGDAQTALDAPYSIILTEELSKRIFKEESPVGKTVEVPGYAGQFKVTGVLKPFPGKTHIEFTALGSLATQVAEEKLPDHRQVIANWQDYYATYNFVRLKPDADVAAAELALSGIAKTGYEKLDLESRDEGYSFRLQPLDDITPGVNLSQTMGAGMPVFLLWFFIALGAIVMFSACFNYTNLTIARALVRTKEVGIRKVLGANRQQVFWQFVGEAVITALLALVFAIVMMKIIKPLFLQLSFTEDLDVRLEEDWLLYGQFLVFTLLVGLVAGLLPALTFSRTTPLAVLQKLQNLKFIKRVGLRKALLTSQFTITLLFFLLLNVVWRQVDHSIHTNFGFDKPQTLLVELQGQPFDKVETTLSQVSGVEMTSGISHTMGTWGDMSDDVRSDSVPEKKSVREYFVDHRYLPHFGIKIVAGDGFQSNPAQQQELFAIVNQTFVQHFKLGEQPAEALGKSILVGDSLRLTVRGVTEDFRFKPANYSMEPLLLRYAPAELGIINLEISGNNPAAAVTAVEQAWKKLDTGRDFRGQFYDEEVRENYAEMLDLSYIVAFFGIMGMVIACMGLLGMAIYTVETKAKEVSIRKVLGANAKDVVLFLSKGYLWLLGIAIGIALPLSYLAANQLLQTFAERIKLGFGVFLPGVLLLLVAAAVTIGSQTVRAAFAKPMESLRSE